MTFIAHEAFRYGTHAQVRRVLNRHEVRATDGTLVTTYVRRVHVRRWTRQQVEHLLRPGGCVDVRAAGTDNGLLATGHAS